VTRWWRWKSGVRTWCAYSQKQVPSRVRCRHVKLPVRATRDSRLSVHAQGCMLHVPRKGCCRRMRACMHQVADAGTHICLRQLWSDARGAVMSRRSM